MLAAQNRSIQAVTEGSHDWRTQGACADCNPDIFFDFAEEFPEVAQTAKAVCRSCPFRQRCLDTAMLNNEEWGIWGGMDPDERKSFRSAWERRKGGRGVIRTIRTKTGIMVHDPSIERRYAARLKAAQECRAKAAAEDKFHRRDEFMAVLDMIISHPMEDSGTLGRRLGFSKAWFNTIKRDAYARFGIEENYEGQEEIA